MGFFRTLAAPFKRCFDSNAHNDDYIQLKCRLDEELTPEGASVAVVPANCGDGQTTHLQDKLSLYYAIKIA